MRAVCLRHHPLDLAIDTLGYSPLDVVDLAARPAEDKLLIPQDKLALCFIYAISDRLYSVSRLLSRPRPILTQKPIVIKCSSPHSHSRLSAAAATTVGDTQSRCFGGGSDDDDDDDGDGDEWERQMRPSLAYNIS
ncbi:hypothetical protein RRG08_057733 [Elysia crispata]|uniref:Uncharacterized protein n=1 Tax=Elysia crispata TaxID=231223 RepID=A0AAE0Y8N0_9GAST|nr:hypothetical protein RRG08_057733 [Elysia crispata]